MLKFSRRNAKLGLGVCSFSLPSGYTCPAALTCKSKAVRADGVTRVVDASSCKVRCFSASQEALYPSVYNARQYNLEQLRACGSSEAMANLIHNSLPNYKRIRIHVGGDFYSQAYFDAWCMVARREPHRLFYAYTKSLNYWIARYDTIPPNLVLTASYGGRYDDLIERFKLRSCRIVYSKDEATKLGLPIDHDDSHAQQPFGDFALLLHGTQPKGSQAAQAKVRLQQAGWNGYSRA